jgi:hypothetical protein
MPILYRRNTKHPLGGYGKDKYVPLGTPHQSVYSDPRARNHERHTEETLLSVWRQAILENLAAVVIDGHSWPVKRTARRRLRQVDFQFDGKDVRGLE